VVFAFTGAQRTPFYEKGRSGQAPFSRHSLVRAMRWGSGGKDARFLNKLRRLLSKAEEADRKLIMHMAQKMARPNARRAASN